MSMTLPTKTEANKMSSITTKDGTQIYYKDLGTGEPVVFSHGGPLNADSWEAQMLFLATHGYRCIAHDRRGHGRSSQPGTATTWTPMPMTSRLSWKSSTSDWRFWSASPRAVVKLPAISVATARNAWRRQR